MDGELRVHVGRPSLNRQEFSQAVCYRDGSPLAVCGWVYEHQCKKQTRTISSTLVTCISGWSEGGDFLLAALSVLQTVNQITGLC